MPMNPTVHEREMRIIVYAKPLAVSTRDWASLSEPSLLPVITSAVACRL